VYFEQQTYHHLEQPIGGRFPFQTNSNLTGNNVLYAPSTNTDGSTFESYLWFFTLAEIGLLGTK